ncbi:MAG: HAD family hydrolase [Betaproteobacteria bacterium]
MFRLIVFDLDGTLVDSRRDIADAANELLVACGGSPLPVEQVGRMVGEGVGVLVGRAFAAAGIVAPPDALARFLAIYDAHLLRHTRPYDGIPGALEALGRRAPLAVLTNKPLAATRKVLDGVGLAGFFPPERVLGGDGPQPRKPDGAGLRQLAAAAHIETAQTVLVGDSLIDWQTARDAGSGICLASYGFGFEGFPTKSFEEGVLVVGSPNELPHVL